MFKSIINLILKKSKKMLTQTIEKTNPVIATSQQIKIFKLTSDCEVSSQKTPFLKDRIFVQWRSPENGSLKTWLLATPILPRFGSGYDYLLYNLQRDKKVIEIELSELTKLKPHFHKEFKNILNHFNIII